MRKFRALVAASAAAVMMVAGGALVSQADDTPTVYNTPGGQMSGGRLWSTGCEKYASNVVRCRTDIWATTVRYSKGRYVEATGWTFNNLSYLPSPRASWSENNLGRTNPNWVSEGRHWRTECDTTTTGRGGCRSYMLVNVIKPAGGSHVNQKEWVFNNLTLFSSGTIPAVTRVPAHILDQSPLGFTGVGPIRVGASMKDLATLGYMKYPGDVCDGYGETALLSDRGIRVYGGSSVTSVLVTGRGVETFSGARVGMTYAEVKAIYGDRITLLTMNDPIGADVPTAVLRDGTSELVFTAADLGPLTGSSRIGAIVARRIAQGYPYGYETC